MLCRLIIRCCAAALILVSSGIASARAEDVEADRLLQYFDELVLHRSGDDSKSGQVRKWVGPIRVKLTGTQTGFYGPDAVAALRRIAAIAGVVVEELPEDATDANYVMEFLDTTFLMANGRLAGCVATTRADSLGRIVFVRLQLNYRNPLSMQRCVDHEIGHSFGLGHSHVADSVMSYASGRTTITPLDRVILRTLYDARLKPGTLRLAALEQAKPILAEHAGQPGGPADYIDIAARRMIADGEAGDIWTQNQLGKAYETGSGRPQNYRQAASWYRRAADAGSPYGMLMLGWFASRGFGQAADPAAAVQWYRKAATRGLAAAQNNLGVHLRDGRGVATDTVEAMKWFELAAKNGDPYAGRNREQLAAKMDEASLAEARRRAEGWKPES